MAVVQRRAPRCDSLITHILNRVSAVTTKQVSSDIPGAYILSLPSVGHIRTQYQPVPALSTKQHDPWCAPHGATIGDATTSPISTSVQVQLQLPGVLLGQQCPCITHTSAHELPATAACLQQLNVHDAICWAHPGWIEFCASGVFYGRAFTRGTCCRSSCSSCSGGCGRRRQAGNGW
jgi:hypothetical protein